jgi:hypothetical protein
MSTSLRHDFLTLHYSRRGANALFGMIDLLSAFALVTIAGVTGLRLWRWADNRAEHATWARLARMPVTRPALFDPGLVSDLPEPAQRYFRYVIAPGARLSTVSEIDMVGELSLGTKGNPGYRRMRARQMLCPYSGLVWRVEIGRGRMRVVGSDGLEGEHSWSRFWLFGLLPLVRAGNCRDHLRAAFGRLVGEAAFWAPAALLPQNGVVWEAVDEDTARATVSYHGLTQTVEIRVDAQGCPIWVLIPRWTDANADKVFRVQPFGGFLSEFCEFQGFTLPTRVEAGNFFGTQEYFPFYKARVRAIRFLYGEPKS